MYGSSTLAGCPDLIFLSPFEAGEFREDRSALLLIGNWTPNDAHDAVWAAGGPFAAGYLEDRRPAVYCRDGVVTELRCADACRWQPGLEQLCRRASRGPPDASGGGEPVRAAVVAASGTYLGQPFSPVTVQLDSHFSTLPLHIDSIARLLSVFSGGAPVTKVA